MKRCGNRSKLGVAGKLSLPTSAPQVSLHNRLEALELKGEASEDAVECSPKRLSRASMLTPCLKTALIKKQRRIIAIGNIFLRRTKGLDVGQILSIGTQVRDITRSTFDLVCPSEYYLLLIVQAGRDDIIEGSLRAIKKPQDTGAVS